MHVTLSSNIPHYYYAALALQEAGYLQGYICAIATRKNGSPLRRLLAPYWQRKLQGRDVSQLAHELVHSIWLPELLQRGLSQGRILSAERANWLNNALYDRMARRFVVSSDVFHFSSSIGLLSARKAKAKGAVIICDSRTEFPDYQRSVLRREYEALALRFEPPGVLYDDRVKAEFALADYLIVPSHYARDTFVAAGFNNDQIFVVPYGVDLDPVAKEEDRDTPAPAGGEAESEHPFRIIYAGQLIPRKGIHYLLEAFAALSIPNAELLLLGRIDDTLAPRVAAATSADPRIKALGSVPKVDLAGYFRTGSLFVLPTLADSWGLVTAEAMAAGLPVIVTRNAGSSEIIREGQDGFVIAAADPAALRKRIMTLYAEPERRRVMGHAARERVQLFTWKRYQRRLREVYDTIATCGTPRDPLWPPSFQSGQDVAGIVHSR